MVTTWVVEALTSFFTWFMGLLPGLPSQVDGVLADATESVDLWGDAVSPTMGAFAYWLPVEVIMLVLAAWLVTWFAGVGIRVFRMAVSLFTGGGGSVG